MILILLCKDRWNVVGECTRDEEGNYVMTHGRIIRDWGTTHGIGEIAYNGPTKKTILDPFVPGEARIHPIQVNIPMSVNEDKWRDHVGPWKG